MTRPVRRREPCPLDGHFTMSQAEEMLGLRGGGLQRWMKRRGMKTKRVGKYRCVTPEQLERYERETNRGALERVGKRPAGYVGVYRAAELAGCGTSMVWKEAERGNVHAVRVGYIQYYNPGDCLRLAQSMNERPLPGYAQVLDFAKERRADMGAALRWLEANGGEPRKFRRPQDHQIAWYALRPALEAWAAQYRHANRGQKLTLDQAREIRTRRAAGERRCALAREFGVSEALVRQVLIGKTYREPLAQAAD